MKVNNITAAAAVDHQTSADKDQPPVDCITDDSQSSANTHDGQDIDQRQSVNKDEQDDCDDFVFDADADTDNHDASDETAQFQLNLEWMSVQMFGIQYFNIT